MQVINLVVKNKVIGNRWENRKKIRVAWNDPIGWMICAIKVQKSSFLETRIFLFSTFFAQKLVQFIAFTHPKNWNSIIFSLREKKI